MLKAYSTKVTVFGATLIAVGLALSQTSAAVRSQAPDPPNAVRASGTAAGMGQMMGNGQAGAMMAERQKMMANMKATDKQLDDLVAKMDAARGADKVDAIAAVVKAMVADRMRMREQMMMQGGMMEQMMSMPAGQNPSDADHAAHHPGQ